jgi:hypothetical protein
VVAREEGSRMSGAPASSHAAQRLAWDRLWRLLLSDEPVKAASVESSAPSGDATSSEVDEVAVEKR